LPANNDDIILFEDSNLLIADKPENSIVHGIKGDQTTFLEKIRLHIKNETGQYPAFLAPSNRLDRNTRGPVVFSKNRNTAILLRKLFSQCRVQKVYKAILSGSLTGSLFVEADIIPGTHKRAQIENLVVTNVQIPEKKQWFQKRVTNSKTISATYFEPLKTIDGLTLVDIFPWTGRYHQIRVVCQAIGYPIYGDRKYNRVPGKKREKKNRNTEISIQSLICKKLKIEELNIAVESRFVLEL